MNIFVSKAEPPFSERRFKVYTLIEFVLSIGTVISLLALAGKQGMWIDELNFTWGVVSRGNFMDVTAKTAEVTASMYLYMWLMMPLSRVLPYGELWLRLPSIIFFLLSVLAIRKLATEVAGKDLGFFAFILAITTRHMWTDTAWEARPYSLWVLLSALTTLTYLRRINRETPLRIAIYGILMALQFYTHMFSILTIAFFALTDLVLFIMKKVQFRCIISYIIALVLAIPAIFFTVKYSTIDMGNFWPATPGNPILALGYVAFYFLGNPVTGLLFLLSTIGIVGCFFINFTKRDKDKFNVLPFLTFSILWVLGITYVYSQFINPNGSLWVFRYFSGVWPQVYIITAFGGIKAVNQILKHTKLSKQVAVVGLSLFLGLGAIFSIVSAVRSQLSPGEAYREVAEQIASDKNAYADDKSIILTDNDFEPWVDYYFNLRGLEAPRNIKVLKDIDKLDQTAIIVENYINIDEILAYDKLYICEMHTKFDENIFELIKKYYDTENIFVVNNNGIRHSVEVAKMWVFTRSLDRNGG